MKRKNVLKWKKACICLFVSCACLCFSKGEAGAQTVGVTTNALGWLTLSPNLGVEVGFARHWSASLDFMGNPFTYAEGRKTQAWGIQPEVRYWTKYQFAGHVFGIHGQYAQFDMALRNKGNIGNTGGVGISYGYAYILSDSWNVEATIGVGYSRVNYMNTYDRLDPQIAYGPSSRNYWGITKLGVKFTYFIKFNK